MFLFSRSPLKKEIKERNKELDIVEKHMKELDSLSKIEEREKKLFSTSTESGPSTKPPQKRMRRPLSYNHIRDVALDVIHNRYSTGERRKQLLLQKGYTQNEIRRIQLEVNLIMENKGRRPSNVRNRNISSQSHPFAGYRQRN